MHNAGEQQQAIKHNAFIQTVVELWDSGRDVRGCIVLQRDQKHKYEYMTNSGKL